MASSATNTTSNLARFRSLIAEWETKQPPPRVFSSATAGADVPSTGEPLAGSQREGKDVVVAFRTRPPLPREAEEKFIADPNRVFMDDKSAQEKGDGANVNLLVEREVLAVEFCPGISVRSADPGVMVVNVPGMKVSLQLSVVSTSRLRLHCIMLVVERSDIDAQVIRSGCSIWTGCRKRRGVRSNGCFS